MSDKMEIGIFQESELTSLKVVERSDGSSVDFIVWPKNKERENNILSIVINEKNRAIVVDFDKFITELIKLKDMIEQQHIEGNI